MYATEPHFADHLAPTWWALPPERRGRFVIAPRIETRFRRHGIRPEFEPRGLGVTVVAGFGDLRRARKFTDRVIYSEHGAGQSYQSARVTGSYIGSQDRAGVIGILVPGPDAGVRARDAYPSLPVFEVGCPKLDRYLDTPRREIDPAAATVAVSFHWDAMAVAPEARSAWMQFNGAALKLTKRWPRVIGHGHPRAMPRYAPVYARAGLDVMWNFDDVIDAADVYVIDNSSTLFEWVALDRPAVVMNARWYRRDVDHGLRFWDAADVGVQCDSPAGLADAVADALDDTPERAARRAEVTAMIYTPGPAAPRAAAAVVALADGV